MRRARKKDLYIFLVDIVNDGTLPGSVLSE